MGTCLTENACMLIQSYYLKHCGNSLLLFSHMMNIVSNRTFLTELLATISITRFLFFFYFTLNKGTAQHQN